MTCACPPPLVEPGQPVVRTAPEQARLVPKLPVARHEHVPVRRTEGIGDRLGVRIGAGELRLEGGFLPGRAVVGGFEDAETIRIILSPAPLEAREEPNGGSLPPHQRGAVQCGLTVGGLEVLHLHALHADHFRHVEMLRPMAQAGLDQMQVFASFPVCQAAIGDEQNIAVGHDLEGGRVVVIMDVRINAHQVAVHVLVIRWWHRQGEADVEVGL